MTFRGVPHPSMSLHPLAMIRERHGITQAHLAKIAGLSVNTIQAIEWGRRNVRNTTREWLDGALIRLGVSEEERSEIVL